MTRPLPKSLDGSTVLFKLMANILNPGAARRRVTNGFHPVEHCTTTPPSYDLGPGMRRDER
jgi:hypothetical protein